MNFYYLACCTHGGEMQFASTDGDAKITIHLTEQEADTIRSMAERFYSERQALFAEQIAEPIPAIIDFSEAP